MNRLQKILLASLIFTALWCCKKSIEDQSSGMHSQGDLESTKPLTQTYTYTSTSTSTNPNCYFTAATGTGDNQVFYSPSSLDVVITITPSAANTINISFGKDFYLPYHTINSSIVATYNKKNYAGTFNNTDGNITMTSTFTNEFHTFKAILDYAKSGDHFEITCNNGQVK